MLEDVRALVEFAAAGSVVGAADRLHRTPSAVTRKVQRLEAALNAELLDRSAKPPRLTPLGQRVLEQGRDLLQRAEALKASASEASEPQGVFRLGVSHALADGALVAPVRELTARYPGLRLNLLSELTGDLFERLGRGELDAAAVLLPFGHSTPAPLLAKVIATDRMEVVQSAAGAMSRKPEWQDLAAAPWVLNPPGCLLRAALFEHLRNENLVPNVAAEIHNMHLQRSFVAAGYGLGLLPKRFVRRRLDGATVRVLRPVGFQLAITVSFVRAGHLGSLEAAASFLEKKLRSVWMSDPPI